MFGRWDSFNDIMINTLVSFESVLVWDQGKSGLLDL